MATQNGQWTQTTLPSGGVPIPSKSGRPWVSFSNSPGGTLYGVTPGGSRIKYQREDLLKLKDSPLAKKSKDMPDIPGITLGSADAAGTSVVKKKEATADAKASKKTDKDKAGSSESDVDASPKQKGRSFSKEDLFQMDSD